MSTIENDSDTSTPLASQALREEIAKILEEFLIKDLEDRKAKISKRRYKSDPFTERIRLQGDGKNNGVPNSQTFPDHKFGSSLKSSRELDHYISPNKKENGFDSSGESDGEQAEVTDHPKKKSRFKKAAAIIGHYLKRKQKKKVEDGTDSNATDDQFRKGSEMPSMGRIFKGKKNSIFQSFRKIKSSKKAKPGQGSFGFEAEIHVSSDENEPLPAITPTPKEITSDKPTGHYAPNGTSKRESDTKPGSFAYEAEVQDSDEDEYAPLSAITPTPKEITSNKPTGHYAPNGTPGTYSRSISSSTADANLVNVDLRGSSSSTVYPASDLTSNTARSSTSNALDDPGEEIDYIDLELPDGASVRGTARSDFGFTPRKMSQSRFLGSEGIKNLQWLAQAQMDKKMELQGKTDGVKFSKIRESNDAVDGASSQDKPTEAKRQSSREELYSKIATKLAELAGNYSPTGADKDTTISNASPVQEPLTELEREIIACIRSEGDRNSAAIEEKFEAFAAQVTEESYNRFKRTIQSSVKQELSWDHIAFVFYTTKAVVSAVGKGTRSAAKVKEYTLDYISDTFATWIIDQGGFDNIVSSSDSDFDVD